MNELISGIKSDVAIKIFGEDIDRLRSTGEQVAPILAGIEGASDVKIEQVSGFSQIEIEHDRAAMAQHKINAADINLLVEAALGGKETTTVFEGQKRFSVVVRFPAKYRSDIEAIRQLMVPSRRPGTMCPLASWRRSRRPKFRRRSAATTRCGGWWWSATLRGRDIGTFVAEAKAKLASLERGLPVGYRLAWGGAVREPAARDGEIAGSMVPVAILMIFILLFMSLSSVKSSCAGH